MKKIFVLAFAAASIVACNNGETSTTTTDSSNMNTASMDTSANTNTSATTTTSSTYTASEGDVTYKNNKVMIYKGQAWVPADKDITLDSGVVVYRDGRVVRNGTTVRIEDGQVVSRTGNFFDKAGNALDNAWDATKTGAKAVGGAVKDAANAVGNKVHDAVTDDDKKKDKKD